MRIIAISDIHGCNRTFQTMVREVLDLKPEDHLVLCGDYIDRGPDSKGVVDFIFKLREEGHQVTTLKGNHEVFLLHVLDGGNEFLNSWLYNGGKTTLASYHTQNPFEIDPAHQKFYQSLVDYAEIDDYIFVHAGVGVGSIPPLEDTEALLWSRYWYDDLDYEWLGDRYIIHGHTPQQPQLTKEMFAEFEKERILNIDTGCVYNNPHSLMGQLCAVDLTNRKLYFQPNID